MTTGDPWLLSSSDSFSGFKFSRASYLLSLLRPQIYADLELKVERVCVCVSTCSVAWGLGKWAVALLPSEGVSISHGLRSACPQMGFVWPTQCLKDQEISYTNQTSRRASFVNIRPMFLRAVPAGPVRGFGPSSALSHHFLGSVQPP